MFTFDILQDDLLKKIEKMGGTVSPHLTKQVTHLIAVRIINSPKYISAKKLKIPIVLTSFVEDCWSRSHLGSLDLCQMEISHNVPILFGCSISITGLPSEERVKYMRLIQNNGGTYSPDFSSKCTHLIVGLPEPGQSLRSSPKIVYAKKWEITMVKLDWLLESLRNQMCLEDSQFRIDPSSFDGPSQGPTQSFLYNDLSLDELNRVESLPQYFDGLHFYVGDQQPSDRLLILKRLILGAGGTRHSDLFDKSLITHFIVHNQTLTPKEQDLLKAFYADGHMPIVVHDQWLFACFYAKEMTAIEKYEVNVKPYTSETNEATVVLTPHSLNTPKQVNTSWSLKISSQSTTITEVEAVKSLPIFSGLNFHLLSYDEPIKSTQVQEIIEKNGGIISDTRDNSDYIIGPLLISSSSLVDNDQTQEILNEIWISTCLHEKKLLVPSSSSFFKSIIAEDPVKREPFSSMKISVSGFSGMERDFYSILISELGAQYTDSLSKKNTHLICAAKSGPKYDFAKSCRMRIVSTEWLLASAKAGKPLATENYPVAGVPPPTEEKENKEAENNQCKNKPDDDSAELKKSKEEPSKVSIIPSSDKKRQISFVPVETPIREKITKKLKEVSATVNPTGLTQNTPTSQVSIDNVATPIQVNCSNILKGSTFAISQRLWHRREEMHDLVVEMGGAFMWSYDASCTHYIHQGNIMEESFREFKSVRKHGKWIVSPWWLIDSKKLGKKLSESQYPHIYNPNSSSSIITQADPPSTDLPSTINPSLILRPTDEETEQSTIDFDSVLAADRKPTKPTIIHSFSKSDQRKLPGNKQETPPELKVFALSGISADQRSKFPNILSNFGSKVLKSNNSWDPETTHLIIGGLSKSEKFLAACAAGVWILRPEFVESSEKHNTLLTEADYEWQPSWSDKNENLSRAPRYWREYSNRTGKKAFQDWNVLLAADQKRIQSLFNILEAGGAKVTKLSDLPENDALGFTHILVSSAQMKSKIPTAITSANSEKVHNVEIIAEHLITTQK